VRVAIFGCEYGEYIVVESGAVVGFFGVVWVGGGGGGGGAWTWRKLRDLLQCLHLFG